MFSIKAIKPPACPACLGAGEDQLPDVCLLCPTAVLGRQGGEYVHSAALAQSLPSLGEHTPERDQVRRHQLVPGSILVKILTKKVNGTIKPLTKRKKDIK
jgi:hypothetical protein